MTVLRSLFLKRLVVIILCFLLGLGLLPPPAVAQPLSKHVLLTGQVETGPWNGPMVSQYSTLAVSWWPPFRRQRKDRSGRARGRSAGRRGQCNALNQSFVALVPNAERQNFTSGTALGFTAQEQPNLFVYLPDLTDVPSRPEASRTVQFMIQRLQENDEIDVLPQAIDLSVVTNQAGIAELSFEKLGVILEPDQAYHWYLSIICDPNRPSRNPSVEAWIETVDELDQRAIAQQISLIEDDYRKAEFYIKEQGIWYESVDLLMNLRCQEPNNRRHQDELKAFLGEIFVSDDSDLSEKILNTVESQQCPRQL